MEPLDQRIKRLREKKGLSQQAVADKVGVSRVAVTKWESGLTANLKLDNLLSLCELFGVSVEELVRGVGTAQPDLGAAAVSATESAWKAYEAASEATRAAIDLLLLPHGERLKLEPEAQSALVFVESVSVKAAKAQKRASKAA